MRPIRDALEETISAALCRISGREGCPAIVRAAADPRFGDYQANGVMAIAKQMGANPRKLAEQVAGQLGLEEMCLPPEVAGPGFINLRIRPEFLGRAMLELRDDPERLGIERAMTPKTVVVDYSGPNIAKQMHVGHLRSTIIGDCICRTLEFLGHNVIRQNHIGDWGTQFGRVLLGLWHLCMSIKRGDPYFRRELKELAAYVQGKEKPAILCRHIHDRHEQDWQEDSLREPGDGERYFQPFLGQLKPELWNDFLEAYQYVNVLEDVTVGMDLMIPTRQKGGLPYNSLSRHVTVMLQEGGELNRQELEAWQFVRKLTLAHCNEIYQKLSVGLNDLHVRGESAYNDDLPNVVADLKRAGLAVESEGAVCVFPEGFKNKEGQPLPFIIQKSDGAFLYATTDLAALRYRVEELKAEEIVYVTDARQAQHFAMLFAVARKAGWAGPQVELRHVTFGTMLGADGKPFKTRSGETVKLKDLLDEAIEKARAVVEEKNPELPEDQKNIIAQAVGIGAVKYADYSNNRDSDYIFSFDKMLAMEGNTAPYMQYAYARVSSIERKAEKRGIDVKAERGALKDATPRDPAEIELAKQLVRYGEAIATAAADCRPNFLTAYLYDLAQKFSQFYNACPVLDAEGDCRARRLLLCELTARTIRHGLSELLGIDVVEQM